MNTSTQLTSNLEKAQKLLQLDEAVQKELNGIEQHRAILRDKHAAADDGEKPASQIVAERRDIEAEIKALDEQEEIYTARVKSRLKELHIVHEQGKTDLRDAENQHRTDCSELAKKTWKENSEQVEGFRDLVMALCWLRNSSHDNITDAVEFLLEGKDFFKMSESFEAAKGSAYTWKRHSCQRNFARLKIFSTGSCPQAGTAKARKY